MMEKDDKYLQSLSMVDRINRLERKVEILENSIKDICNVSLDHKNKMFDLISIMRNYVKKTG